MRKQIYFKELPKFVQNKILDAYGANSAEEIGLDKEPYAVIEERDGRVEAVGMLKTAI